MSIPKDGYYSAIVRLDTGGEMRVYVRVLSGHPYLYSDRECRDRLLWSACRGFEPADAMQYCAVWPSKAAAELETLRTANKALVERVKRLEEAGDFLMEAAHTDQDSCVFDHMNRSAEAAWNQAKEAKP